MTDGWEGEARPLDDRRKPAAGGDGDSPGRPPEPVLEECPVTPLGINGLDFYYFQPTGQLVVLAAGLHNRRGLKGLFAGDLAWVKRHFPSFDRDGNLRPGSWSDDAVGTWLMDQCRRAGLFDASAPVRGLGVWRDGAHRLVVHCGDVLFVESEVRPAGKKINGVLYPAAPPIARPALQPAAAADGRILLKALDLWTFRDPLGPECVLGFMGAGFLGGAPDWRPHMMVRAKHGSGKTWLAELVAAGLGAAAHPMQNNYSEAGLRQALTGEARVLVLDEAESTGVDSRVRAVIELLRHMSGGAGSRAVRGTTGGRALGYQVTGCAYLSAILPPPLDPQDKSRIMILDLMPLPKGEAASGGRERVQKATAWAQQASPALRARATANWGLFVDCFGAYHAAFLARGCSTRQADQLGTILAGRDLLLQDAAPDGDSVEQEVARFAHLIDLLQQDEEEGEGEQCLNHLYSWPTDLWRSGDRRTVGEMIMSVRYAEGMMSSDYAKALQRIGLRVAPERGKPGLWWLVVANRHDGLARIFDGTRWAGGGWATALAYLDNAKAWGNERYAGAQSRGVGLPTPWLPERDPPTEDEQRRAADDSALAGDRP